MTKMEMLTLLNRRTGTALQKRNRYTSKAMSSMVVIHHLPPTSSMPDRAMASANDSFMRNSLVPR